MRACSACFGSLQLWLCAQYVHSWECLVGHQPCLLQNEQEKLSDVLLFHIAFQQKLSHVQLFCQITLSLTCLTPLCSHLRSMNTVGIFKWMSRPNILHAVLLLFEPGLDRRKKRGHGLRELDLVIMEVNRNLLWMIWRLMHLEAVTRNTFRFHGTNFFLFEMNSFYTLVRLWIYFVLENKKTTTAKQLICKWELLNLSITVQLAFWITR